MSSRNFLENLRKMHTYQITRSFWNSEIATTMKLGTSSLVLLCIIDHYNIEQQKSWPKQSTIAEKTGLSINTVKRSIEKLQNKGLIITSITKNGNIYKLTNQFFEKINLDTAQIETSKSSKKSFLQPKLDFSTAQIGTSYMNIEENKDIKHDHEHNEKNDVNAFYISNDNGLRDLYKQTLAILDSWRVFGSKKIINDYGLGVINNLVSEIAGNKSIYNKGAYFRKSLEFFSKNQTGSENDSKAKNPAQDQVQNQKMNNCTQTKNHSQKNENNAGSENCIQLQKNENNNKIVAKCSNCNEFGYINSEQVIYNRVYPVTRKCECGFWKHA